MFVITKSKELMKVVFEVTDKSPKKFRFSLVSRMQNLSMDILKNLYMVNETYIDMKLLNDLDKSILHYKNLKNKDNEERMHNENKLLNLKILKASKIDEKLSERFGYKYKALTELKELDGLVTLARQMQCITGKNQERLSIAMCDVRSLIGGWIKKEKLRLGYK